MKKTIFFCILIPGLPLGIYTNHWHRTVNSQSSLTGEPSCRGSEADGGRCPRSSEYVPDMDYDLQGIFEVDYSPEFRAASLEDIHYLRH